jgi:preprotein translocase subunit SecE
MRAANRWPRNRTIGITLVIVVIVVFVAGLMYFGAP